jgi:hypothetical protein
VFGYYLETLPCARLLLDSSGVVRLVETKELLGICAEGEG